MSHIHQITSESNQPLQVGITGGIGSGKSTVCRIFEQLGIPVYNADERAKALMVGDANVISKIKKLFGDEAYLPDGSLHRKWIGGIVFQDSEMLKKLNSIVHPAVQKDGEKWHKQQHGSPYTLKESALLFEIGSQIFYDKTIVVYSPKEIRLQRVMARDSLSKEAVEARIKNQMEDEKKMQLADYVIINDGRKMLVPQVLQIHQKLVAIFSKV
ncbi:MAG: dephospho-CoA kinase [Bacteroidetes bacterium]|nr:dephospho-CoA kinase [Bacteroidota bacterium]